MEMEFPFAGHRFFPRTLIGPALIWKHGAKPENKEAPTGKRAVFRRDFWESLWKISDLEPAVSVPVRNADFIHM